MSDEGRTYRIAVAAQAVGLSEQVIRAWERRHGVLKPRRTASGYRTYSDADIEILRRLRQLTEEGVAIGEAVKLLPAIVRDVKDGVREPKRTATQKEIEMWQRAVLEAARELDQARIEATLDIAIGALSPLAFFDTFIGPLMRDVGDRWHAGTLSSAEEHLVTQACRQRVVVLLSAAPRRLKRHVVCACAPNDEHELGLLGAALHFRHAGFRVTFLGARTPLDELLRVAKGLSPQLVALSIVRDEGVAPLLKGLAAGLPEATHGVVGGPGVTPHRVLATGLGLMVIDSPEQWPHFFKERR